MKLVCCVLYRLLGVLCWVLTLLVDLGLMLTLVWWFKLSSGFVMLLHGGTFWAVVLVCLLRRFVLYSCAFALRFWVVLIVSGLVFGGTW